MNADDPRIAVTTNERTGTKHLVEPYAEAPVVNEHSDGTCGFCGHAGFRRSRVRFTDVLQFLLLKYPVRCTRCGQRQYVPLRIALQARAAKLQTPGPSPDKPGSWKAFTAGGTVSAPHARPATTAAEPLAGRLDDAFKPGPPARLGVPDQANSQSSSQTSAQYNVTAHSQPIVPRQSTPPAHTPSRRSDDSGIW